MVADKRFVDYFVTWRAKGYSEEQIKAHLLKSGYSAVVVDSALIESRKNSSNLSSKLSPELSAVSSQNKFSPIVSSRVNSTQSVQSVSSKNSSFFKNKFYKKSSFVFLIVCILLSVFATTYFIMDENLGLNKIETVFSGPEVLSPDVEVVDHFNSSLDVPWIIKASDNSSTSSMDVVGTVNISNGSGGG